MRFLADDGLFGFIVTPRNGSGMYRFQLVIQGELVGDEEPCFLDSAMRRFAKLCQLNDRRLGRTSIDAAYVMSILESDEVLHDSALLQVAESLDGWKVRGYIHEGSAVFLSAEYGPGLDDGQRAVMASVVPLVEYGDVFGAAYDYWEKTRHGRMG